MSASGPSGPLVFSLYLKLTCLDLSLWLMFTRLYTKVILLYSSCKMGENIP